MSKQYAFGVDVGGTSVKLGLFTLDGRLMERWQIPTRTEDSCAHLLQDIADAVAAKRSQHAIELNEVLGVGVGVPGAVRNASWVEPCVNLNQWGGFDVAEAFHKLTGLNARIANDANAAALGEMWQGGAKGYRNVVFVTLGTGVGGGIIVDGRLLSGAHGAGGEVGHIKIYDEERICGCGKRGCLEQYASATGVAHMAKTMVKQSNEPSQLSEASRIDAKIVFDCARQGDALALSIVKRCAEDLGKALAAVSCVCDPEIIVIGGGMSASGDILLNAVREEFKRFAFPASETTAFAQALLGNDAGIYGGVRLMIDEQ